MGYLRRSEPARGYGEPMEATALVLDDGSTRIVLVGADLVGASGTWAQGIRDRIGAAVGRSRRTTFSSTRSTPTRRRRRPAGRRSAATRSGTTKRPATATRSATSLVSAAVEAARRLRPARLGLGRTIADEITVNRRQRRRGRDDPRLEPRRALRPRRRGDPGRRRGRRRDLHRRRVRRPSRRRRAGRAGGIVRLRRPAPRARARLDGGRVRVPPGLRRQHRPVRVVPHRAGARAPLRRAARARRAAARAAATPRADPRRSRCRSPPRSRWRSGVTCRTGEPGRDARRGRAAASRCRCSSRRRSTRSGASARSSSSASPTSRRRASRGRSWNPVVLHVRWAKAVEQRVADGTVERSVEVPVQALRIGGACITAWPCEPFCELGLEVKERSLAPFPVTLGYSNDLSATSPTRARIPVRGLRARRCPAPLRATGAVRPGGGRAARPAFARAHRGALRPEPLSAEAARPGRRDGSLVEAATEAIRAQILQEKLAAGDRLPTERVARRASSASRAPCSARPSRASRRSA